MPTRSPTVPTADSSNLPGSLKILKGIQCLHLHSCANCQENQQTSCNKTK
ncbi:hypothetical protein HanPSC8_Chr08g0318421 [Helianthus annuus]|nr:hypothetical protein HanPSC8_Chr08g0318421 [Helianthus annuus]